MTRKQFEKFESIIKRNIDVNNISESTFLLSTLREIELNLVDIFNTKSEKNKRIDDDFLGDAAATSS